MINQLHMKIAVGSPEFYQLSEFEQLDLIKSSNDEEALYRVVCNEPKRTSLCYAAVQNILSEKRLFDIALEHSNYLVRRAAVEKIFDDERLCTIFDNEDDELNRYVVIKNTANDYGLLEKARGDKNPYVRELAMHKLSVLQREIGPEWLF